MISINSLVKKQSDNGHATAINSTITKKTTNAPGSLKKKGRGAMGDLDYMNVLPIPTLSIDRDFNIQYMNSACAQIASTPEMLCIGVKCADMVKAECCNTQACPAAGVFRDGKTHDIEMLLNTATGEHLYCCHAVAVRNDAGEVIGALEYFLDLQKDLQFKQSLDLLDKQIYTMGEADKRIDTEKLEGTRKYIGEYINRCYDFFLNIRTRETEYFKRIGRGERNIATREGTGIGVWKEHREGFNSSIIALNQLIGEVDKLIAAANDGNLSVRGDATGLQGVWADTINGFNYVLDSVVTPVNEVSDVLTKFASGDLRCKVTGDFKGDLIGLKEAANQAIENNLQTMVRLRDVAKLLTESADDLSKATGQAGQATSQIANATQQVAKGAADQANSMQETIRMLDQLARAVDQIAKGAQEQSKMIEKNVAMVHQVSSAIKEVSTNAEQAMLSTKAASDTADNGAEMVQKTIKGMEVIKETIDAASAKMGDLGTRSREIGKIVATINDIADQTNLLALNAAIEAARAGEQGRGFAVVADEVRKLAERSSSSTKEIAELISAIQAVVAEAMTAMEKGTNQVAGGYDQATKTGGALEEILTRSREMAEKVLVISGATKELAQTSTEMVKLSDSISAVVEQNTAATEEMSATARQIAKSIESVAGIAEQNSAATQEVSASAEEISAQMAQVSESSDMMIRISEELKKQLASQKL